MHIAVCIKQVPVKNTPLFLDTEKQWINESQIPFEINEADLYALEEALKIKDSSGAEITVITLGAKRCTKALTEALAKGADQSFQIDDEEWFKLEPFQVASALANTLKEINCDLIMTGLQSDDQGFSQTGVTLAELLDLVHASMVVDISLHEKRLKVKKELESGLFQYIELSLPAVLTIQSGINNPRYANMKGILQAKKKLRSHLSITDQLDNSIKATQKTIKFYFPEKTRKTEWIDDSPSAAAEILLKKLKLIE